MTFTFNSKDTYIAARTEWKARYKKLSIEIRLAKLNLKTAQREGHVYDHHIVCLHLKQMARGMLDDRAEMKLEAQRQWISNKQAN